MNKLTLKENIQVIHKCADSIISDDMVVQTALHESALKITEDVKQMQERLDTQANLIIGNEAAIKGVREVINTINENMKEHLLDYSKIHEEEMKCLRVCFIELQAEIEALKAKDKEQLELMQALSRNVHLLMQEIKCKNLEK